MQKVMILVLLHAVAVTVADSTNETSSEGNVTLADSNDDNYTLADSTDTGSNETDDNTIDPEDNDSSNATDSTDTEDTDTTYNTTNSSSTDTPLTSEDTSSSSSSSANDSSDSFVPSPSASDNSSSEDNATDSSLSLSDSDSSSADNLTNATDTANDTDDSVSNSGSNSDTYNDTASFSNDTDSDASTSSSASEDADVSLGGSEVEGVEKEEEDSADNATTTNSTATPDSDAPKEVEVVVTEAPHSDAPAPQPTEEGIFYPPIDTDENDGENSTETPDAMNVTDTPPRPALLLGRCRDNAGCTANGDNEAVCVDQVCRCSEGFEYPLLANGERVGLCFPEGTNLETASTTVHFNVRWVSGNFAALTAVHQIGVTALLRDVFGPLSGVAFVEGSIVAGGVATTALAALDETALRATLQAKVEQNAQQHAILGSALELSLATFSDCRNQTGALEVVRVANRCVPVKCELLMLLRDNECISLLSLPEAESSSGLGAGAVAGIVVGVSVGLAVIIVAIVLAIKRARSEREPSMSDFSPKKP